MKIKISIGDDNPNYGVIVLDAEHAGIAAQLLAHATIYKKSGYYADDGWVKSNEELRISYTDDKALEPIDPKITEAQERARKADSERYVAQNKATELQKLLDTAQAQLAAIQSVTVCQVTPVEQSEETDTDNEGEEA